MQDWNHTTFIECDDISLIRDALIGLCKQDGYAECESRDFDEIHRRAMQYSRDYESEYWAFAVLPGANGWSVLKTLPLAMMARPLRNSFRPRLSLLCEIIPTNALCVYFEDGVNKSLLECSFQVDSYFHGSTQNEDHITYSAGRELNQEWLELGRYEHVDTLGCIDPMAPRQFQVLTWLNKSFGKIPSSYQELYNKLTDYFIPSKDESYWSNDIQVLHLIHGKPVDTPGAVSCFLRREP